MLGRFLNKRLNNISIGSKIGAGIFLVTGFFLIFAFFVFGKLNLLDEDVNRLSRLTENTTTILDINKDITELQRTALVYGTSGSNTYIRKMRTTYQNIQSKLNKVLKETDDPESKSLTQNMIDVVRRYGENIDTLQNRYKFRTDLIDKRLPEIQQQGTDFLKNMVTVADSVEAFDIIRLTQSTLQLWLEANLEALSFIKTRRFNLKRSVYEKLLIIAESNRMLEPSFKQYTELDLEPFYALIEEFRSTFDQAVQANRIYLSLVNVVMAGEALEFTTLSNKLRERTLSILNDISEESRRSVESSERIIQWSLFLSIPFLIAIAFFYNATISRGIEDVSNAFKRLLKGDDEVKIPGLNRLDEIGQLANAANAFKDMSESLKIAKQKAEESTKIKSEFLANMSHEIRTPMNGILGMITLIKGTQLTDEQREMLSTISSSGDSLMTILNDILDLSKAESGKIKLEYHSFSLEELLKELSFMFTNLANDKGILFKVELPSKEYPDYIIGDITRLKQVLINLLSNAVKFTEEGLVKLSIEAKSSENGYLLNFKVSDTGIGVGEDARESLFSAFSQADASITRKFGGTGLGLAISAKLVQLMHSEIKLDSELGIGSEFSFEVYFDEGTAPAEEEDASLGKAIENLEILLVEDNSVNIKIATLMLEKLGYQCDVAENGQIAVDMVRDKQYSLILMDMQMPVMDGVQASRIIKTMDNGLDVPIIAMTANVLKEDREKCFAAGMEQFIPKPINIKVLRSTIETVAISRS